MSNFYHQARRVVYIVLLFFGLVSLISTIYAGYTMGEYLHNLFHQNPPFATFLFLLIAFLVSCTIGVGVLLWDRRIEGEKKFKEEQQNHQTALMTVGNKLYKLTEIVDNQFTKESVKLPVAEPRGI